MICLALWRTRRDTHRCADEDVCQLHQIVDRSASVKPAEDQRCVTFKGKESELIGRRGPPEHPTIITLLTEDHDVWYVGRDTAGYKANAELVPSIMPTNMPFRHFLA